MNTKVKYTIQKASISDKITFHESDIVDATVQTLATSSFTYNLGDRFFTTLEYDETTGICSVPSGAWSKLNIKNLEDKRFVTDKQEWVFNGTLKENQQEIVDKVLVGDKLYSGLIQAPCGFGKSFVGSYIIANYGKPTIVVCHTILLAEQWLELLSATMDRKDIGFIGDGRYSLKPITVAIYKSLIKRLDEINDKFEVMLVDECLDYDTYVNTTTGRQKIGKIVNNKLPVQVESWNEEKKCFEYKRVYNWFKNKQDTDFLLLKTSPKGALSCTENHLLYTYDSASECIIQKPAKDVVVGDKLVSAYSQGKTNRLLSKSSVPILLGLIIGDGSLEKNRKNNSTRIKITHGEAQLDYFRYKLGIIKDLFTSDYYWSKSGYSDNRIVSASSVSFYDSYDLVTSLYSNTSTGNKNKITKEIADILTIESWSLIYQDDGSISHKSIRLSVCELDTDSINHLIASLNNLFGIKNAKVLTCSKGFNYLTLGVQDSKIFLEKIRPFIHPSMRYKDYYYDNEQFTPIRVEQGFKDFTFKTVTSIGKKKPTYGYRYNISVEDNHNYCTATALVGNCHLCPAATFSKVVNGVNAKVKLALSATPWRKDGMHVILPDYFGPNKLVAKDVSKLIPSVEIIKTTIPFPIINPNRDWTKQLTKLATNTAYLNLIAAHARDKIASGRCLLIVAERLEMLEQLKLLIPKSILLVGATKNRDEILNNVGTKYDAVLSTKIFDEGISCHRLDTIYFTCPGNNPAKLEQRIGRIQREHLNKRNPLVVDFWLAGAIVQAQQRNRLEWYIKNNFPILKD